MAFPKCGSEQQENSRMWAVLGKERNVQNAGERRRQGRSGNPFQVLPGIIQHSFARYW